MRKLTKTVLGAAAAALMMVAMGGPAQAIPALQLDLEGATIGYYGTTETIVTADNTFKVWALAAVIDGQTAANTIGGKFRLAISLVPNGAGTGGSFDVSGDGTFNVDGNAIDGTAVGSPTTVAPATDMNFGTPLIEDLLDKNGMPKHGIFATNFVEIDFTYAAGDQIYDDYNTQDFPGGPSSTGANELFGKSWDIDISNLTDADLHFDLYKWEFDEFGDEALVKFAPFSHDAASGDGNGVPMAEPGALAIFGLGLIGLGLARRRRAA